MGRFIRESDLLETYTSAGRLFTPNVNRGTFLDTSNLREPECGRAGRDPFCGGGSGPPVPASYNILDFEENDMVTFNAEEILRLPH